MNMLAVGDSIIAGVGAKTQEYALVGQVASRLSVSLRSHVNWQAAGQVGDTATDLNNRLDQLPNHPIQIILLSVGVNDVTGLTSVSGWRRNLHRLLDRLQTQYPDARIVMAGLPPLQSFPLLPSPLRHLLGMRAQQLDRIAIEVIESKHRVHHVPVQFPDEGGRFANDGYHPSEQGYAEFADQILVHFLAGLESDKP